MRSNRENQDTYFIFKNFFSRKSCRSRDNVENYGTARQTTGDNKIERMRIACWITKAANTHSDYTIPIAFARQQWLRSLASLLRLRTICLSCCVVFRLANQTKKCVKFNY